MGPAERPPGLLLGGFMPSEARGCVSIYSSGWHLPLIQYCVIGLQQPDAPHGICPDRQSEAETEVVALAPYSAPIGRRQTEAT